MGCPPDSCPSPARLDSRPAMAKGPRAAVCHGQAWVWVSKHFSAPALTLGLLLCPHRAHLETFRFTADVVEEAAGFLV